MTDTEQSAISGSNEVIFNVILIDNQNKDILIYEIDFRTHRNRNLEVSE